MHLPEDLTCTVVYIVTWASCYSSCYIFSSRNIMNYAIEEMKNVERLVTHPVYVMYMCMYTMYIILIILLLVHNKAFFYLN